MIVVANISESEGSHHYERIFFARNDNLIVLNHKHYFCRSCFQARPANLHDSSTLWSARGNGVGDVITRTRGMAAVHRWPVLAVELVDLMRFFFFRWRISDHDFFLCWRWELIVERLQDSHARRSIISAGRKKRKTKTKTRQDRSLISSTHAHAGIVKTGLDMSAGRVRNKVTDSRLTTNQFFRFLFTSIFFSSKCC